MHFKFGFIHAYQDQENINVPIMFPWKEKLFVHTDILTKIFEILRVITLLSAVTRSELGDKMCMLIRSIPAKKKKKEYRTRTCKKSVDSFVQVCNLDRSDEGLTLETSAF